MIDKLCKSIDKINTWVARVVSLLIVPMVFFTGFEVVARYVFNAPTLWVWPANVQIQAVFVLMGAGYTLLVGSHVKVDFFYNRFSPQTRAIIDLLTSLIVFWCIGSLVWESAKAGWDSFLIKETYSSVIEPPLYPLKMLVPLAAFLLLIQLIVGFIRNVLILTAKGKLSYER